MLVTLKRFASDIQLPKVPDAVGWTAPAEGRVAEDEIEFSWAGETARHIGSVVHRWLQRIAEDELRGWDGKRVDALKPWFGKELERRGVSLSELKRSSESVASALKNTLGDERGRWVLGPHREARSEFRIRVQTPEGSRTFVMDRVFTHADGVRWIVDYKTSRHEGANVEAFLDQERKRYAAQLDAYAAALGGASRGLYFPVHSGWRSW